jgi:hypothetical protein
MNAVKPESIRVIKSRRLKWAEYVARMEGGRIIFILILTDKPIGNSLLGRGRHR